MARTKYAEVQAQRQRNWSTPLAAIAQGLKAGSVFFWFVSIDDRVAARSYTEVAT
jgi:hypothetical protein